MLAFPVTTVYVAGVVVIVYDVAGGEDAGRVQDKLAAPPFPAAVAASDVIAAKRYGLITPILVAVNPVTALGSKKLSCAEDFLPIFLFAIYFTPVFNVFIMLLDLQPIAKYLLLPW